MSVDLSCDYTVLRFFTSQTADEMSFDLNPAIDLNLSLKIPARGDWGVGGERQRWEMNETPDLCAAELLTCLKRLAIAETREKLNSFSQVISWLLFLVVIHFLMKLSCKIKPTELFLWSWT